MTKENLENKIGFQIGFLLYSGKTQEATIEHLINIAMDYGKELLEEEQSKNPWIKIESEADMPKPNQEVLIICDYTEYYRGKKINKANVHFTEEPIPYGGSHALTGRGELTGTYFSIPAILNPKTVTHWMPLPQLPIS